MELLVIGFKIIMFKLTAINMKNLLILFLTLYASSIFSQNNLYLKEKDTIFIVFDTTCSRKHVVKEYSNINLDEKRSPNGLNTIYFLLDSTHIVKRNKYYKKQEEHSKSNFGSIGASSTCDWCYGLYFVHKSNVNYNRSINDIENDIQLKSFKKQFLEKEYVTLKDSLEFDRGVYLLVNYRYNPPISNLLLSKETLKNKNVFYFDGSTKKYNELKELLKEPHYLFMLDKTWVKQELDSKFSKTEYFIFNEVLYRAKTRSPYPELRN